MRAQLQQAYNNLCAMIQRDIAAEEAGQIDRDDALTVLARWTDSLAELADLG